MTADIQGLLIRARGHARKRELDRAAAAYRTALERDPACYEAWIECGGVALQRNDAAEAEACFGKAVALRPDVARGHYWLGVARFADPKRWEEAEQAFRQAVAIDPGQAVYWNDLGVVEQQRGKLKEAADAYREVLGIDLAHARAHYNLGLVYQGLKQWGEACAELEQAARSMPASAEVWSALGAVLCELERSTDAEAAVRKALTLDPDLAEAHFNLGVVLGRRGERRASIAAYERAAALRPDWVQVRVTLGREARQVSSAPERARRWYAEALALDAGCVEAQLGFAELALDAGLIEEAERAFEALLAQDADHADALFGLSRVRQAQQRHDAARALLEHIVRVAPKHAVAPFTLGNLDLDAGRREAAVAWFRLAVERAPQWAQMQYFLALAEGREPDPEVKQRYTRDLFDIYSENFDEHLTGGLGYRIPERLRDGVTALRGVRAPLDVLDLGCGTGLCGPLFRPFCARLAGVDLSPGMLEKARAKGVYDELVEGELLEVLRRAAADWDVLIAGDVFIYVGPLEASFAEAARALRPGGLFAFSVEAPSDDELRRPQPVLRDSGRWAHAAAYVRELAAAHGFHEERCEDVMIRAGQAGFLFAFGRK